MQEEFNEWKSYIKDILINCQSDVYLKGGSVLGLKLLNLLVQKCDPHNFQYNFSLFKQELGRLIKDWDFVLISQCFINYNTNFSQEGKKVIIIRYKDESNRMMVNNETLIEMAIKNTYDPLSELEIPLTSMKINITLDRIEIIFSLIEKLYLNHKLDLEYLNYVFNILNIVIDDHDKNALFQVNNLDNGNLSNTMLNCIKLASKDDKNIQQFLISHIKEPDRLFFRLFNKNIPKAIKIKEYFNNDDMQWLPTVDFINVIVDNFINILKDKVNNIYQNHYEIIKMDYNKLLDVEAKIYTLECDSFMSELNNKGLRLHECINELNDYISQKSNGTYIPNNIDIVMLILSPQIKDSNTLISMKLSSLRKKVIKFEKYLECYELYDIINDNDVKDIIFEKKNRNKYVASLKNLYNKLFNEINIFFENVNIGRLIEKINIIDIDKLNYIFSCIIESDMIRADLINSCTISNLIKKLRNVK